MSVYSFSSAVGLILCLTLEFPMTALLKEILRRNIAKLDQGEEQQKMKGEDFKEKEMDELNNNREVTRV